MHIQVGKVIHTFENHHTLVGYNIYTSTSKNGTNKYKQRKRDEKEQKKEKSGR